MVCQLKHYLFVILLSGVVTLFLILVLPVHPVRADGIIVNSLLDTVENNGACTLREAIINANNDNQSGSSDCLAGSGFDVIMFNSSGTIFLTSALPDISTDLQIDGTGQNIVIDGGNTYQIMRALGSVDNQVIINGLTLQNGATGPGGALWNNSSNVTINDSTFRANTAITAGGAIHNIRTMTINRSTFENNRVTSMLGTGGAVSNMNRLTINNSTFYTNEATYQGGGLYLTGGYVATVTNSTFSNNGASDSGGGLYVAVNTLHLRNTILANSSFGGDCGISGSGTIGTNVGNLVKNDSCGLTGVITSDPTLSPLADNGGETQTMAMAASSPARNAGNNGTCLAKDQRGHQRQDGLCDIGAYEVGATTTSPPYNIEIVAGNELYNISTNSLNYTANGPDARIGVNVLRSSLRSGPVTIQTGVPGTGTQQGNITLSAPLDFNGIGLGRSLTLNAAANIRINANISDSAPGGDSLNLTLTGDVDGNGDGSIQINGSTVDTAGGNITMIGQGHNTHNDGISVNSTTLNAGGGNISLTGRGGVGANAHGIHLVNASLLTTGSGDVTLTGMSGSGQNSRGMLFNGASTRIQTYDGDIRLNGQGQGTSESNGVGIGVGPVIQALNHGNIFIEGRGSTGPSAANWTVGVDVYGTISTISGDITITGTGGGTNDNNHSIHMNGNGKIASVGGRISLSGTTTINATGLSYGIYMRGNSVISGSHGISLNGYDDVEAGIRVDNLATIHSHSGPLTMTASSMAMNLTTKISGTNTIRLQPRNPADDFSLTNNELSALVDGFSRITIGRDDSRGVIGLNGPTWAVKDPLLIQAPVAGGSISLTTTSDLNGTDNASIELRTVGTVRLGGISTNRQPITIAHGGMGITPFIVGDASINGSVNNLTTADVTVATTQFFLYDYFAPPNLWILSGNSICPLGTVAYVNQAVSGGDGSGKDWANAYPELRTVLDTTYPTICPAVNEVWVARGVYTPGATITDSFNMLPNVAVYGGFDGTETVRSARNINTNLTVLSGDIDGDDTNTNGVVMTTSHIVGNNTYNVIYNLNLPNSAILDGFTITAGQANGAATPFREQRGGGIHNENSSPTLNNLIFNGNFAVDNGGAIYNDGRQTKTSSPKLSNVIFYQNAVANTGGAMFNNGVWGTSSPELINVTFYKNAANGIGGAILNDCNNGTCDPTLTNVILWQNTSSTGHQIYNTNTALTIRYSLIQNGMAGITQVMGGSINYGPNMVTDDPRFIDAANGNLQLDSHSPAIDAGNSTAITLTTDVAGQPRFYDDTGVINSGIGLVDMGAYERQINSPPIDLAISKTVSPTTVLAGDTVTYTLVLSNVGGYTATNILITDTLPTSLTVTAVSSSGLVITQINSSPYVWQVANMGIGDRASITMTGQVTGITNLLSAMTLTNLVNITATGDVLTTSNNIATAIVTVSPPMQVVATNPSTNAINIPSMTNVTATFNNLINVATVMSQTFMVHSSYTGRYDQTLSAATNTATLNSPSPFKPGETVFASLTAGIESDVGIELRPYGWQFTAAVNGGFGKVYDSLLPGSTAETYSVALGDLDGDGDLDAVLGQGIAPSTGAPNRVWMNDGSGRFTDSVQSIGGGITAYIVLGDLDGDNDLDIFISNCCNGGNEIWLNNGSGIFSNSGQTPGNQDSGAVALGDLNGDGSLDAFLANDSGGANQIWLNDGAGTLSATQSLGSFRTEGVALGDIDGDGDLDAFTANRLGQANRIWLNQGGAQGGTLGSFAAGQTMPGGDSWSVALGDLDGDGDLDAFVANHGSQANQVWRNDNGTFSDTLQTLGNSNSTRVALGDLDGDGDLDAYVSNSNQTDRIWLNNGSGLFSPNGQTLHGGSSSIALGDVDGDGDLDAFIGQTGGQADRLLLNEPPPDVAVSKSVTPTTALPGDTITYTIRLENQGTSAARNVVVTDTFPLHIINSQVSSAGVVITQTSGPPTYRWQIPSITDTQQGFITITGQVPLTIGSITVITNRVILTATDDLTPTNNVATATLTIARGDCYATHDNGTTLFNSVDAQAVREASNLAAAGGTVKVAGLCRGVKQQGSISQTLYISKPLTIQGGYTASNWLTANPTTNRTVLDAQGGGRVVIVQSTATTVTLENLILRHGDTADSGAAIRVVNSPVVISNSRVISNRAAIAGGGIYINGSAGRLLVQRSQFRDNQAGFGGAIKSGSSGQIMGSRFENNQAITNGGALDLGSWHSLWQVYTSTFVGNAAQNGHGGAIGTAMPLHIDDSVFRGNQDQGHGGGAIKAFHPLTVTRSIFVSNTSTAEGGAIFSANSLSISKSRFRQNRSNQSGGAIYQTDGSARLSQVRIIRNQANNAGGGIAVISGSISITRSRILTNTALVKGGALYQNSGGTTTIKNSCIVANSDTSLLGDSSVTAPNNWWGAPSGPSGAGPGGGDSVNNLVDFNNFLTAPALPNCPTLLLADLVISKTVSPLVAKPNETVQFTLNINNVGLTAATNITLTDLLPTGLISPSTSSSPPSLLIPLTGSDYRWRINQLNVGQAVTVTLNATVNSSMLEGGLITNTASISHETTDLTPNNNIASATLTITPTLPDLVISKTVSPTVAQPGQQITYTLSFTNQGVYSASGVVISDVWPTAYLTGSTVLSTNGPPLTQISGPPTYTWQVGTLGVGQFGRVQLSGWLTADLASGITFSNRANIHGTLTETEQANNHATAIVTVVAQGVDLHLSKTVSLTEVRPLERVTYTLTAGNQGDTTANNVVISDTLPTGLQVLTVSMPANISQTVRSGRKLVWQVAALSAGQQATLQLVGRVALTATAGPMTNTALITVPTGLSDIEPTNNHAAAVVMIRRPQADVGVQKTVSPTVAVVGERITYTISFSNAGPGAALQVILTDSLPKSLTDIRTAHASRSPTHPFTISLSNSNQLYRWQVEQLPPQASGLITLSGRLTGVTSWQRMTNSITMTTLSSDTHQANNQAAVGLQAYGRPQLAFSQAVYQVAETELTTTITATLKAPHGRVVQAIYNSLNNSAVAGLDYLTATGRLTFAPGVTQTTFVVTIVDDKLPESTEQLTLTLTELVSTRQPSTATAQLLIVDDDKPLTAITLTHNSPMATGQTTTFTLVVSNSNNVPLSYTIDFGDGNGPTTVSSLLTSTLHHTYTQPGTYTVVTTVTNGVNILTTTTTVVIQSPVTEVALTSPTTPTVSLPLTFTAQVTGGSSLTYTLDFGDGTTVNGPWPSSSPISHTYTQPGTYTVIITVGNQVSLMTDTLVLVVPQPTQPITGLMIIPPPSPLATNKPLPFTAALTVTEPISYLWDFGDGTGGTGITPTHVYTQPGTYTVILTATNGIITQTVQTVITVDEPIDGLLVTTEPLTPTVNTPVSFTTKVTSGTNISYTIDFGDGTPPLINPPTMPFTHVYTTPGVYTVTITATNSLTTVVTTVVVTVTKPIIPPATDLLRLTHRVSREVAVMGDYMVYETVLENVGSITATAVQLSHAWPTDRDGLPAFYGFNHQQSQRLAVVQLSKGEVESCLLVRARLTCQIEYLAPNSRATLNLMLSPRVTGTLVSTAQATAAQPDPNPANNQGRVETLVSARPTTTTTVSAAEIVPQAIYLPLLMK